jgi:bifunctional DNA-binding transcriptional regulator/antitoxin component of YhaV-PrlF toxin-antitoxin module
LIFLLVSITILVLLIENKKMRVTTKGQVTIPLNVRESMGILPTQTEIEFLQDEAGRWYLAKAQASVKKQSRFRTAHKAGKLQMTTEEIMSLTRGE